MPDDYTPTPRTRVVREPHRGIYDRATAYQILDEGLICHVGFIIDGQPFVIPTGYGRKDDSLYIHGSAASRMLRNLDQGIAVCVTVTLLDGLVLARSKKGSLRPQLVTPRALAERLRSLRVRAVHPS